MSNFNLSLTPHRLINATWTPVPDTSHYVLNYYPAGSATSISTQRITRPASGWVNPVRFSGTFPHQPGRLDIHAIVASRPVLVGSRTYAC